MVGSWPKKFRCPECGETFICDPGGDCWCKASPVVKIPEALKGEDGLCRCLLEKLHQEQESEADENGAP